MHRDKSCLLFLSLAHAPFAQIPIKSRVFDTQGRLTGVFNGGVDEVSDALQLHKDKEEFVRVGGPKLHKSPPPRFVLGGVNGVQSGWWLMDGADELPSPFSRRYVMATEKQRGLTLPRVRLTRRSQ